MFVSGSSIDFLHNAMKQVHQSFMHQRTVLRLIGHPHESKVKCHVFWKLFPKNLFVKAIGFANLSFSSITIHCMS